MLKLERWPKTFGSQAAVDSVSFARPTLTKMFSLGYRTLVIAYVLAQEPKIRIGDHERCDPVEDAVQA